MEKESLHLCMSLFQNSSKVESFARIFVDNIRDTGEFSNQGAEDFDDVINSLVQAQSVHEGHPYSAMAKALQLALSSSIAELIIAENEDEDVGQKTAAITDALKNAQMQAFGEINEEFIGEIVFLVELFSSATFNNIGSFSGGNIRESLVEILRNG
ncbi:hypothetical protein JTE90_022523 [Oedothorax gibbosus]|uniref:Spidroin N-terminal domain-containing protein n=1 Tax=Oedothorax gibbosus TaxID=931172 RepID=A0AAV6UZE3_9ARAC|nr:hypothetical protein JTE90_022523 [Oedothorax gibbosus]